MSTVKKLSSHVMRSDALCIHCRLYGPRAVGSCVPSTYHCSHSVKNPQNDSELSQTYTHCKGSFLSHRMSGRGRSTQKWGLCSEGRHRQRLAQGCFLPWWLSTILHTFQHHLPPARPPWLPLALCWSHTPRPLLSRLPICLCWPAAVGNTSSWMQKVTRGSCCPSV